MGKNDKAIWLIASVIVVIIAIAFYLSVRKKKPITPIDLPICHQEFLENGSQNPDYLELIIEPVGDLYYQCTYYDHILGHGNVAGLPIEQTETGNPPLIAFKNWLDFNRINSIQYGCGVQQYYDLGGT